MTQLEALKIAYDELSNMIPDGDNDEIFEAAEVIEKILDWRRKMKVTIEVDILDKDIKELNGLGYNLNDATEIKVSLDYGDKVIYCDGYLGSITEKADE